MNKVPDVSVALCTFNGGRYLQEQLSSIANQTHLPREIVISDDGSTDDTFDVIESFTNNLKKTGSSIQIKIFTHESKLGISKNFEFASLNCKSEFIAFCDQDDVWPPDKLEILLSEFVQNPQLLMVFSDADLVNEIGSRVGVTLFDTLRFSTKLQKKVNQGKILDLLLKRNVVTGATTMVCKKLLIDAFPAPDGWLHDEWCAMYLAISHPGQILALNKQLLSYRQHGQNQVGAAALDTKQVLYKLFSNRTMRNNALLKRAESLNIYIQRNIERYSNPVSKSATQKFEHELLRSGLPNNHLRRIIPVFTEFLYGRYYKYGNGLKDALRDLLQPG